MWTNFGHETSNDFETTTREFYRTVKTMRARKENNDPAGIVNDKGGKPMANNQASEHQNQSSRDGELTIRDNKSHRRHWS